LCILANNVQLLIPFNVSVTFMFWGFIPMKTLTSPGKVRTYTFIR
jgi:hypothetical protein